MSADERIRALGVLTDLISSPGISKDQKAKIWEKIIALIGQL